MKLWRLKHMHIKYSKVFIIVKYNQDLFKFQIQFFSGNYS